MKYITSIAIVLIATYALSTRASAEEVYRCGSTYSQNPCPDGLKVDVQDSRTPAQKAEADAKTRAETAQVQTIEKAHQKEEAQRRADNAKLAAAQAKLGAKPSKVAASEAAVKSATASTGKAKKKTAKAKKEPDVFIASAATDKPKAPSKPKK